MGCAGDSGGRGSGSPPQPHVPMSVCAELWWSSCSSASHWRRSATSHTQTHAERASMWCTECAAVSSARCGSQQHPVVGLRAGLQEQLQRLEQQRLPGLVRDLGDALHRSLQQDDTQVLRVLGLLSGPVSCELTLRPLQEEAVRPDTLRLHTLNLVCEAPAPRPQTEPMATAKPEEQLTSPPEVVQAAAQPEVLEPAEEAEVAEQPSDIDTLDVEALSQADPSKAELQEKKAAVLELVSELRVRHLLHVRCNFDPQWCLQLLQRAAPLVQVVTAAHVRAEHLAALQLMPHLRHLEVAGDYFALEAQAECVATPPLPPLPPHATGLRRLRIWNVPCRTTLALLRAHSATLQELHLQAGTRGDKRWALSCPALHVDLDSCRLRALRRLVLHRGDRGLGLCSHEAAPCRDQLAALCKVLPPHTVVLCSACHVLSDWAC